jgi:nickel-type superoxide dismutase maturation protease
VKKRLERALLFHFFFLYRCPSWRSCEHLAHTVRDSGRTTRKPESCFRLEMRWLEAQRDRRLETSGTKATNFMISWYDLFLLAIKRKIRVRIEGDSMLPTFKNGDEVLVSMTKSFSVGDVAYARHPFKSSVKIIKRIDKIEDDGSVFLVGDNLADSSDSRTFGAIPKENIIGKITS